MTTEQILSMLGNNGLALVLLVVAGFAIRHTVMWLEPRASRWFDAQLNTMDTMRRAMEKQTDILLAINDRAGENAAILKDIHFATRKCPAMMESEDHARHAASQKPK